MSDGWLVIVAITLIVAVPFDWIVALRFLRAAAEKPYLRVLTLAAFRSIAIALAATVFGVLGASVIYFAATGYRLLPSPVSAILIAIAAVVISVPNIYALRLLQMGDVE